MSVTVIDARQPREPIVAKADLAQLQVKAANRDAHGILELALTGEFQGRVAVYASTLPSALRSAPPNW